MKHTYWLILMFLLVGCQALSQKLLPIGVPSLELAMEHLASEEYYQARKATEQILEKDPENEEARDLMVKIIEEEIARHKELFETSTIEEFTDDEKSTEIETWLERSRFLFEVGRYDQALSAAEKVFLFDSQNGEASRLMDEIRSKAIQEGRHSALIHSELVQTEIKDRVERYQTQANEAFSEGRLGEARFAVDKLLLIDPENESGLLLRDRLREKLKQA